MVSNYRIDIEKFNEKKIDLQKIKTEDLLVEKEQWVIVDPGTQPNDTQYTGTQTINT
jgi:hypothetical protein